MKDMTKSITGIPEGKEIGRIEQNSIWDLSLELFQKFPNQDINPEVLTWLSWLSV